MGRHSDRFDPDTKPLYGEEPPRRRYGWLAALALTVTLAGFGGGWIASPREPVGAVQQVYTTTTVTPYPDLVEVTATRTIRPAPGPALTRMVPGPTATRYLPGPTRTATITRTPPPRPGPTRTVRVTREVEVTRTITRTVTVPAFDAPQQEEPQPEEPP